MSETRRGEVKRGEGEDRWIERERWEGLISVKRKGKSVALLLVHLEFLDRRERRRTGDV